MGHAGYFLGKMKNQNDAQRVAQEAPSLEELYLGDWLRDFAKEGAWHGGPLA